MPIYNKETMVDLTKHRLVNFIFGLIGIHKTMSNTDNAIGASFTKRFFSTPGKALIQSVVISTFVLTGCDNRYQIMPTCDEQISQTDFGRFTVDDKGVATDLSTGISWYRCPAGSYFDRDTCVGEAFRLSWDGALEYAAELSEISGIDWRMASLEEVRSIIIPGCVNPALNPQVFPTVEPVNLWTKTQRDQNNNLKCTIYTYNGAFSCRHIKTTGRPFMLVKDEDSLPAGSFELADPSPLP